MKANNEIATILFMRYNILMHKRVLKTLEYDKIIDMLIVLCMSEPGIIMAKNSLPTNNKLKIKN